MVTATVIPVQYGVNMLFSKLCTGDYAPLAAKFEDAALTLSKTHLSIGGMIAAVLSGTFAMAVVGSLLAELLTKGRGIVIATTIIGFITCVIGVIIVLYYIGSKYVTIAVFAVLVLAMVMIQYKKLMRMTLDKGPVSKKALGGA